MALTKIGRLIDKGVIKDQTNLGTQAADTDEYLLYDADADALKSIAASNVTPNETLITGKDEITVGNVQGNDVLLIYDTSAGVLKKITKTAFDALQPAFTSATPSNLLSGDGTGNYTIVIAGTDFDTAATFKLVTDGGADIAMDTVTRDSSIQLTGVVAKNTANLTNANEPFDIVVTNGNGLSVTSADAVTIDAQPVWVTASGSLGTIYDPLRASTSFTIQATDPDSGALTINTTLVSGSLPAGATITDNGNGTATISGFSAVGSNTTSTFTVRVADANSNFADRQFTITVNAPSYQSFTSSGTFSVPSGVTAVNVLVVAGGGGGSSYIGGGGGAGGLIYRPGFTVTPGGTVTVTVGCGGAGGDAGTGPGPSFRGNQGQDSVFGTLTAKGGGYGNQHIGGSGGETGNPGGSGGGGGGSHGSGASGGSATQPTQPGDSGTYGFGSNGNPGNPNGGGIGGGGGGGAGAVGGNANTAGGNGGIGKAYTISDGTTSVYYAGGGGGGGHTSPTGGSGGQGGGGGGDAESQGTSNRGGGGNGTRAAPAAGDGGKGIVIVSY
jgi:hypothetical protein